MSLNLSSVFTSERLIYEAFDTAEEATKDFLYQQMARDPEINGLGSLNTFLPQAKSSYIDMVGHWKDNFLNVIICLKPDNWDEISKDHSLEEHGKALRGVPIGLLALSGVPGPISQHRRVGLGISIAAGQQGKGYGTEALRWLADWTFDYGNMHSLRLQTGTMNPKALHVYEKVGFVEEGREREAIWFGGKWYDIVSMSILEHEWRAKREAAKKSSKINGANGA